MLNSCAEKELCAINIFLKRKNILEYQYTTVCRVRDGTEVKNMRELVLVKRGGRSMLECFQR